MCELYDSASVYLIFSHINPFRITQQHDERKKNKCAMCDLCT